MARTRQQVKGRGGSPPFFQLFHRLLDSPTYINLPHPAKSLLVDIGRQYNGKNNGDFCVTPKVLAKRGWNSNSTLRRALKALLDAELLVVTRMGGRHKCSLYGFTWIPIDECGGKLEIRATRTPPRPLSKLPKLENLNTF